MIEIDASTGYVVGRTQPDWERRLKDIFSPAECRLEHWLKTPPGIVAVHVSPTKDFPWARGVSAYVLDHGKVFSVDGPMLYAPGGRHLLSSKSGDFVLVVSDSLGQWPTEASTLIGTVNGKPWQRKLDELDGWFLVGFSSIMAKEEPTTVTDPPVVTFRMPVPPADIVDPAAVPVLPLKAKANRRARRAARSGR